MSRILDRELEKLVKQCGSLFPSKVKLVDLYAKNITF